MVAPWTPHPGLQALMAPSPQSQLRSPAGPRHETARQLEELEGQSESLRQDTQRLDRQAGPQGPRAPHPRELLPHAPSPGPQTIQVSPEPWLRPEATAQTPAFPHTLHPAQALG